MLSLICCVENLDCDMMSVMKQEITSEHTALSKNTKPCPYINWLVTKGYIKRGQTILDYGAGHGRNADWLRGLGFKVYAYDPFNGKDEYGWHGVSSILLNRKFDVVITCYVLNVVTVSTEWNILKQCRELADSEFHITRNRDIIDVVEQGMRSKDDLVRRQYDDWLHSHGNKVVGQDDMTRYMRFARCGFRTSKGYQRIPDLGYTQTRVSLIKESKAVKIYKSK